MRVWAVVNSKGKIVVDDKNHLHPLLVFRRRWEAENAKFEPGEKVKRLEVLTPK